MCSDVAIRSYRECSGTDLYISVVAGSECVRGDQATIDERYGARGDENIAGIAAGAKISGGFDTSSRTIDR